MTVSRRRVRVRLPVMAHCAPCLSIVRYSDWVGLMDAHSGSLSAFLKTSSKLATPSHLVAASSLFRSPLL